MLILKIVAAIIIINAVLIIAAIIHTLSIPNKKSTYKAPPADERALKYAEVLSKMIRYETVSVADTNQREKFLGFHKVMEELFPLVFQNLEKIEIDGNLLMHWKGKKADKPVVLMSHQDVVPAEGEWRHEPFGGEISEGKVWGRGTSDTKGSVMAFYQAVEELLEAGFEPGQDVYLSSSCTEEWGGPGCPSLVNELKKREVKPFLVIDEGGGIINEPIDGIPGNFAMLGVFEKGNCDLKFTARSDGGHASAPPKNSPIIRLAAFELHIEKLNPFNKKFSPVVREMFKRFAPYSGFKMKLAFSNFWLFEPILKQIISKLSGTARSMLTTTMAFTMQKGSDAGNVIPQEASVWVDMRTIPHQGMDESFRIVKKIADRYKVEMEIIRGGDYTETADINGEAWKTTVKTVEETFPGLPAMPYILTGATDAKFYQEICDCVIRFAPVVYGKEQLESIHGIDENIEYNCLPGAVDFYKNIIKNVGEL